MCCVNTKHNREIGLGETGGCGPVCRTSVVVIYKQISWAFAEISQNDERKNYKESCNDLILVNLNLDYFNNSLIPFQDSL